MSDTDRFPTQGSTSLRTYTIVAAIGFIAILAVGTAIRLAARDDLHKQTIANQTLTVNVIRPGGSAADTLVLPGRLQAWNQAPVYSRTNGYLRRWYVDIGQPVRAGQLLAEVDTPEVDQQLNAARAALATADAQLDLARSTNARWGRLLAQEAVSQQDADERRGDFAARVAMRNEATANVQRLQTLTSFKRIVAPFDGIVTSRSTDIGALIVAGTTTTQPLFTISDVSHLRIYVSVPEAYASTMRDGLTARFAVSDHPHRTFEAALARSADSVDPASGSMLVQLVYDNSAGLLKPGAYAQVTFDLNRDKHRAVGAVRIPVSSLLFRREGTAVAIANPQGRVKVQPIVIQTDFGSELEVTGLKPDDNVIDNPPEDIRTDDQVKIVRAGRPGHA